MMKHILLSTALLFCGATVVRAEEPAVAPAAQEEMTFEGFVDHVRSNIVDLAEKTKRVEIRFLSERDENAPAEEWNECIKRLADVLEKYKNSDNPDAARDLMMEFVDVMKTIKTSTLGITFVD